VSSGPWVPISKELVRELPKDRPYTRLEAMFSLTVDFDNGESATIKGYADLWRWSRGKVERFLEEVGVQIVYPEDTSQKQNQRGQIMIQMPDRTRTDSRQIKLIGSNRLKDESDTNQADDEQKTGRSQGTTIYPNTNNKKIPAKSAPAGFMLFRDWWIYAFAMVENDRYVFQGAKDGACLSSMLKQVPMKELVAKACHYLTDTDRFPSGRPTLSLFKAAINRYHGHVNGKADHFREMRILPPEGTLLEDWRPWESQESLAKHCIHEKT